MKYIAIIIGAIAVIAAWYRIPLAQIPEVQRLIVDPLSYWSASLMLYLVGAGLICLGLWDNIKKAIKDGK